MNPRVKEILAKGSILLGGSALAQLFTFISYPVLSHWLTADKWAVFGVFTAVVTLFAVMANGGFEQAILLPKENGKSIALWRLCKAFTAIVATMSVVLLLIKGYFHPEWLSELHFGGIILALFSSVYFEGSIISTVVLLNRAEQYKVLATGRAIQASITLIVQLIMAHQVAYSSSVLVWGWIIGQGGHFIWLNFRAHRWIEENKTQDFSVFQVATEYKHFFRFAVVSSYINTISRQLPFLILPFWISDVVLGQFTFAHKILSAPLGLIGATITHVFNAQSSKSKRGEAEPIHGLTLQWSKAMLVFGLPILLGIVLYGPGLFAWLFGADYKEAGVLAQWLAPWLFLLYWISPLSNLISTENKLRPHFYYNLLLLTARVAVLWACAHWYSAHMAIAGYSVVGICFAIAMLGWLWWLSKNQKPIQSQTDQQQTVKLILAGDTCFSGQFQKALGQHQSIFSEDLIAKFQSAQGVCVNLEGAEIEVQSDRKQGDPVTNGPGSIHYLSQCGVNIFNLANNHILDVGVDQAKRNVQRIYQNGDAVIGINEKGDWSLQPHFICFNGITIAMLAIEEFERKWPLKLLKEAVREARSQADCIILQYHGGEEYSTIPFPFKKRRLERLLKLDVDAVVAHHPHVAQPIVQYGKKILAYSLGNFVFDITEHNGRNGVNEGLLLELNITKEGIQFQGISVDIDVSNAKITLKQESEWQQTQAHYHLESYWKQWARQCHRIRAEETRLTLENKREVEPSTSVSINGISRWRSLFNPPRRSLFIGDWLYRIIFIK